MLYKVQIQTAPKLRQLNSQGKNNNNNDSNCTSSLNLKNWKKLNRQTYITDYIHTYAFALMCAHTAHQSLNSLLKSFQNKFGGGGGDLLAVIGSSEQF